MLIEGGHLSGLPPKKFEEALAEEEKKQDVRIDSLKKDKENINPSEEKM